MSAMGLEGLRLTDSTARPDEGGTQGRKVQVLANCFPVSTFSNKAKATRYHYDVSMQQVEDTGNGEYRPVTRKTDKDLPPALQQVLLQQALEQAVKRKDAAVTTAHLDSFAYDGKKNIFTPKKFAFQAHTFQLELPPRSEGADRGSRGVFEITLKEVGQVDPNIVDLFCKRDRQTIQAASSSSVDGLSLALQSGEVALRHEPSNNVGLQVQGAGGRRFFDQSTAVPISNGAEIWRGFFQSLRPTQMGLVLNLDVAFSCFLAGGPFLEVAAKVLGLGGGGGGSQGRGGRGRGGGGYDRGRGQGGGGGRGGAAMIQSLQNHEIQTLRKKLNGVLVRPKHRPGAKAERFTGFTSRSALDSKFTLQDGSETTIVDYFAKKYNRPLQYPRLPCAVLNRKTMVPLEFCEVLAGSPVPLQRMTPAMTQDMIGQSALKPQDRQARNMEIRRGNAYEGSRLMRAFDMNVGKDMARIEARTLPAPAVQYRRGPMQPREGAWNLANSQFMASGDTLQTFVLLNCTARHEQECRQFAAAQLDACKRVGMNVSVREMHYAQLQAKPEHVADAMREAGRAAYSMGGKRKPPQMFLIFLDTQDLAFYETIKRVAALDLASPVATQCVNVARAMKRGQDERRLSQYTANVAMKINIKLGGTNQVVTNLPKVGKECMFIGADVSHPVPGSEMPSVIASVATTDGSRNRFNSELGAQYNEDRRRKAQEAILDGRAIYRRHLLAWQKQAINSGRLPATVVVFRDGVSEGEYQHVVDREVDTLKEVCAQVKPGYNPKVTFIVCGKRHHLRFYPQDTRGLDRSGNLPPGTVVDRAVVHPYAFDFYLQSQAGLVGTARPAHYQVVKDEIKFSSDELQKLLYKLTYSYARATRSVSLPPMVMYAHILAQKGRALIYGIGGGLSDVASSTSGGSGGQDKLPDLDHISKQMQRAPPGATDTPFGETLWYM